MCHLEWRMELLYKQIKCIYYYNSLLCIHSQLNPFVEINQRFFEGIFNPQNRHLSVYFLFILFLNDLSDFATRLGY